MPPYVSVPYASTVGRRPGYFGAKYLGRQCDPFETGGNPSSSNFRVRNLNLTGGMTIQRLENTAAVVVVLSSGWTASEWNQDSCRFLELLQSRHLPDECVFLIEQDQVDADPVVGR